MNIKMFASVIQYALTGLITLEQLLPQGGIGTSKKQIVMNGIDLGLKVLSGETAAMAQLGQSTAVNSEIALVSNFASQFIDSTVNVLKQGGIVPFTNGGSTAASDVTQPQPQPQPAQ